MADRTVRAAWGLAATTPRSSAAIAQVYRPALASDPSFRLPGFNGFTPCCVGPPEQVYVDSEKNPYSNEKMPYQFIDGSNVMYDSDGDGVLDCADACMWDPAKAENKGRCGCGASEAYFEDGSYFGNKNGIPDCHEWCFVHRGHCADENEFVELDNTPHLEGQVYEDQDKKKNRYTITVSQKVFDKKHAALQR